MAHGASRFTRIENGAVMTFVAVADECRYQPTKVVFVDTESPRQNWYVKFFVGQLLAELLSFEVFHTFLNPHS